MVAIFWIIFIMVVLFAINLYKKETSEENEQKSRGLVCKNNEVRYLGGLPDIAGDKNVTIEVWKEKVYIDFHSINYDNVTINKESIINAEIKSEQQIQNEVSLGKLLLVGVLAFGLKSKKTITNNYLTLSYDDYEGEKTLVFESKWIEELVRGMRQVINN